MEQVQWDDNLSIGVDLIDEQHKALIQRLNDVHKAADVQQGPMEITRTLGFLEEYTEYHFSEEEKHMQENNYPGLEIQQQEHQKFKDLLKKFGEEFKEEGATVNLAEDIKNLLANWLIKHISGIDKEFGSFLKEKNIEIS